MSALLKLSTVAKGTLLFSALLAIGGVTSLQAQGSQAPLQAVSAPAPAAQALSTPAPVAPHASVLFDRNDANAPTLAAAEVEHARAPNEGGNHTIVVSTLVLVLGVVILVLLIK